MPNLLAHYGVQAGATRTLVRRADLKWILLGCLLPDVPWIARRAIVALLPGADPYPLLLYATVQSTLMCVLLLAGTLSLLSARPRRTFGILALNGLLALLLDGLQTKWGNGVHLLAPFDWSMWGADLFFPESPATVLLTALGLVAVAWLLWKSPGEGIGLDLADARRLLAAGLLAGLYLALPVPLADEVVDANNRYLATLRERADRTGRYVEFDRSRYLSRPGPDGLRFFTGDTLHFREDHLEESATVSLRARFAAPDTLEVVKLHEHRSGLRDAASYAGLALLVLVWGRWAYRRR